MPAFCVVECATVCAFQSGQHTTTKSVLVMRALKFNWTIVQCNDVCVARTPGMLVYVLYICTSTRTPENSNGAPQNCPSSCPICSNCNRLHRSISVSVSLCVHVRCRLIELHAVIWQQLNSHTLSNTSCARKLRLMSRISGCSSPMNVWGGGVLCNGGAQRNRWGVHNVEVTRARAMWMGTSGCDRMPNTSQASSDRLTHTHNF